MYFDYQDNLLVCTIDKVSSSTWLGHFQRLGSIRDPDLISQNTSRDDTRDKYYALSKGIGFIKICQVYKCHCH